MIFLRSTPPRAFADYNSYRPYVRKDFQYRCAYCLRHEGHNGGEANFELDHYHPVRGAFGRPDLESAYANLYYACRECNGNKADKWPTEQQSQHGYRFLDPCQSQDDHELHWTFHSDGTITPLTNVAKYTQIMLVLERPILQEWRQKMKRLSREAEDLQTLLMSKRDSAERAQIERRMREIVLEIEPKVFDRPRGAQRRRMEASLEAKDE